MASSSHSHECSCESCNDDSQLEDTMMQLQLLASAQTAIAYEYYVKHSLKTPKRDSALTGHKWIWEMWHGNDARFFENFRMRKSVLRYLLHVLVTQCGLPTESRHVTLEESVAIFLLVVGQGLTYPMVEERLQRSSETISAHFHSVLKSVCKLGKLVIKPTDPTFSTIPEEIITRADCYPHFSGCIGAIDGTHITVHVPADEATPWFNRKQVTSTNVLAICDFKMCFIFVSVGMEGSMHDARVLTECMNNPRRKFPHPPEGKYYLADAGYPLKKGFLTPYKGVKYHLPEFHSNRNLSNSDELFNYKHSSLRSVIERSFGVLKKRWRVLNSMSMHHIDIQLKIIWACFALHNFIRRYDSDDLGMLGEIPMTDTDLSSRLRPPGQANWGAHSQRDYILMGQLRDNIRDGLVAANGPRS